MEDDEDKYRRYAHLPIPTYEEATSSRPTSSQGYRGATEISDDAERQGLLGQDDGAPYTAPTVESARSSEDSELALPEVGGGGDEARQHIEELDYLDPSENEARQGSLYHRTRIRRHFTKHLANLSATFSSLRLPSFRSFYSPLPAAESSTPQAPLPPPSLPPPLPRTPRFVPSFLSRLRPNFAIPDQYRMSAPIFARLCGLFTIASVIYVLFAMDMFPGARNRIGSHFDPESVRLFVQDGVEAGNIEEYLKHITSYDHVAGTEGDYYLASWMQEQWVEEVGFDEVAMLDYYVYLNYPTHDGRSVKIVEPEDKRWTAQLEENLVDSSKQQTLAWHGHSKSGEATGHLIYANGGSREDFQWLQSNDIETSGAIALVRYSSTQPNPALKIKAAHEAGCAGVIIFSDPSIDGSARGEVWPDGRWRTDDSVQRGSVGLSNWILGDPLTPGWPSKEKAKTISKESSPGLPQIPSLPLSWREAQVLLSSIQNQGVSVPQSWTGGPSPNNTTWFSGTSNPDHNNAAPTTVTLRNINSSSEKQRIYNVHALISGLESPHKKLFVGNHRDSFCFGSVDPGSGTAVMMEVVRIFQQLRKAGWRPLRSIEFVSWDAGAFGWMGSTEYVEDRLDGLTENGVGYLNVGAGVWGNEFRAKGSPIWHQALMRVLGRVSDPGRNATLRHLWIERNKQISTPSDVDGDYVGFQTMAGTSSLDFSFAGPPHGYPHGSCDETFEWMENFGDPGFQYHAALAQIWALLILEIADRPIIDFDLDYYVRSIDMYIRQLQRSAIELYAAQTNTKLADVNARLLQQELNFDLSPLREAAANLTQNIKQFTKFEDLWTRNFRAIGGMETADFAFRRIDYNDKLAQFETDLLDLPVDGKDKGDHGLSGREQFKHVIFGPGRWGGEGEGKEMPGVRDAMERGEWGEAMEMVGRVVGVLGRAGGRLIGED